MSRGTGRLREPSGRKGSDAPQQSVLGVAGTVVVRRPPAQKRAEMSPTRPLRSKRGRRRASAARGG